MKKLLLVTLLLHCLLINGQNKTEPEKHLWLSSGLGCYGSNKTGGFTFDLDLEQINYTNTSKIKLCYSDELNLFGPSPSERYLELDFLSGKSYPLGFLRISALGGLGLMVTKTRTNLIENPDGFWGYNTYETKVGVTPCVPVEINISGFLFHESFEIGLTGFGNLNFISAQAGIMIKLGIKMN